MKRTASKTFTPEEVEANNRAYEAGIAAVVREAKAKRASGRGCPDCEGYGVTECGRVCVRCDGRGVDPRW